MRLGSPLVKVCSLTYILALMDIRILLTRPISILLILLSYAGLGLASGVSHAAGISLIRDAEIENTIRQYATPVFRAAGLSPSSVNIYIVKDNSLNAFVAGGQNLFLHTGLLMRSESASQIIGVIAHETGHIAGGHLSRTQDAMSASSIPTILSYILGGAATLATGRGDLGAVIVAGGSSMSLRNFLSYTRGQEASADHAALTFLNETQQSAQGFLEFMQILEDQELLSTQSQDPYVRSHPISSDRVTTIAHHVEISPYSKSDPFPEYTEMHARMKAKLIAFINAPGTTLRTYKETDTRLEARYAQTIAYYRKPDLEKALQGIDQLIAERPSDPYFIELKGQILYENGKIMEALPFYEQASNLLPDSAVIRKELADVQLESGQVELIEPAIRNLQVMLSKEPRSPSGWRQLAIAYGRIGEKGKSSLALAEEGLLTNKPDVATYHAGLAERLFPSGSREWIQAQDILIAAKDLEKRLKEEKK